MNILDLSQLSDTELTDNIKSNVDVGKSLSELQARHSGIFHQKVSGFSDFLEVRDLKENPVSFFYEVAKTYNPEKAKFSTYLGNMTYWECLGYKNQYRHCSGISEVQENTAFELPHLGRDEACHYILDDIENEVDKKIAMMKAEGKTLHEIGDEVGLTAERVRQRFNKVAELYKKRMENDGKILRV